MIFALVASVAFAEVSIGAWGRGLFIPVKNSGASGEDSTAINQASWGGAPRIGFTIAGNSDNVGFQVDMNADGGSINAGDQQKIWVKPMDMLTISIGNVYDDTLRGNAAFGSFNWSREYGTWTGEDVTFTRVSTANAFLQTSDAPELTYSSSGGDDYTDALAAWDTPANRAKAAEIKNGSYGQGFVVSVAPIDALYAVVAFTGINGGLSENLMKNMQIAAGYTIDGIGQIRAQYKANHLGTVTITDSDEVDDDTVYDFDETVGMVEVAFKLTMVENLMVDFGFRMWTNEDVQGETKTLSLYGNYKMDALTLHLLTIYDLNEDDDGYNIGAGVDYDLGDGIGIAGDIRYSNDIKAGGDDALVTFFAGVTKGFSNGKIGTGLQIKSAKDTGYAIPVLMEYWF